MVISQGFVLLLSWVEGVEFPSLTGFVWRHLFPEVMVNHSIDNDGVELGGAVTAQSLYLVQMGIVCLWHYYLLFFMENCLHIAYAGNIWKSMFILKLVLYFWNQLFPCSFHTYYLLNLSWNEHLIRNFTQGLSPGIIIFYHMWKPLIANYRLIGKG